MCGNERIRYGHIINIGENNVGVFRDAKSGKYKYRINDDFGKLYNTDINAAKIGLMFVLIKKFLCFEQISCTINSNRTPNETFRHYHRPSFWLPFWCCHAM